MVGSTVTDPILDYRSVLAYNREVFLVEHGELIKAFSAIDANFSALIEAPGTIRDARGQGIREPNTVLAALPASKPCGF